MRATRLTTLYFDNPVGQAFWIMRVIFTVAPILFGLDKFFNIMVKWPEYLAPWIPNLIHVSPQMFMWRRRCGDLRGHPRRPVATVFCVRRDAVAVGHHRQPTDDW